MIYQMRMFLAEWLLGKVILIAPKSDEGLELIRHIGAYMERKLEDRYDLPY